MGNLISKFEPKINSLNTLEGSKTVYKCVEFISDEPLTQCHNCALNIFPLNCECGGIACMSEHRQDKKSIYLEEL